jgi:hypothetical protein
MSGEYYQEFLPWLAYPYQGRAGQGLIQQHNRLFLSLWIYLWLAETSQQPISQTIWLKVTPHCKHYQGRVDPQGSHCCKVYGCW